MNERDFFYWLQGYFELQESTTPLSARQVEIIKNHMALVAEKKTPYISPLKKGGDYSHFKNTEEVAEQNGDYFKNNNQSVSANYIYKNPSGRGIMSC